MALHEALIALQTGCSGLLTLKQDDPYFKKRLPTIPYVHQGELEILDRLTQLGQHYRTLDEYIQNIFKDKKSGLYILSFAFELRSILQTYLNCLKQLEHECLIDTSLTLSHLLISLTDYNLLFPSLVSLINKLQTNGYRGCQILDIIRRYTLDGNIILSSTMKKLLCSCHKIFIKQITSILTRGQIYDEYDEFFIGLNNNINIEAMGMTTPSISRMTSTITSRSHSPDRDKQFNLQMPQQNPTITPGYSQYQLIPDMLPSYIPLQLADKILFIGESWLILKTNDEDNDKNFLSINSIDYDEQNHRVQQQLYALTLSDDFNIFELERIIEYTRIDLSLTLRNLFVDRFHLCNELEQIRGFYLIEHGELFSLFVNRTNQLLLNIKKSTNAIENDINEIFKQCLNDLHLETILTNVDKFKFKLNFSHNDNSTQETSTGCRRLLSRVQGISDNSNNSFDFWSCGWANLSIQYNVKYPMKAFFSENSKQRYNDIFHLLIILRYVQNELNNLWLILKNQHKNSLILHLRNAMSFFINNFQYYIQIDVLEYKYQQLIRSILSSTDFQKIKYLHEVFLSDIQQHSFMLLATAYQSIRNILSICVSFCLTAKQQENNNNFDENILRQFGRDFNDEIRLLFGILGMVQKHNALPHLGVFLTRLDFNRFLTNNNGSFGEF
ncbi:unnamed protein product [Rotaria sordida]|uniref:Gamma-tubulin complex component n=7 Tax=Rotaria sordida TaxID=392033 RepID=A0A815A0G4_9BILA|nr:unnamed protein product [Rotaria sordida]CAF1530260.1 unnamed protein product [Rotaria sordida]CAF3858167.1 unnamed protein product [Rotaria sordida]CAF4025493.1 unnamed protein product [Rotaria sordida]